MIFMKSPRKMWVVTPLAVSVLICLGQQFVAAGNYVTSWSMQNEGPPRNLRAAPIFLRKSDHVLIATSGRLNGITPEGNTLFSYASPSLRPVGLNPLGELVTAGFKEVSTRTCSSRCSVFFSERISLSSKEGKPPAKEIFGEPVGDYFPYRWFLDIRGELIAMVDESFPDSLLFSFQENGLSVLYRHGRTERERSFIDWKQTIDGSMYVLSRIGSDVTGRPETFIIARLGEWEHEGYEYPGATWDDGGNFYPQGLVTVPEGGVAIFGYPAVIHRFTKEGNRVWSASVYKYSNAPILAKGIVADSESNIYLAGTLGATSAVFKLDGQDGHIVWVLQAFKDISKASSANQILLDAQGDLLIAGDLSEQNGDRRYFYQKISTSGSNIWVHEFPAYPSNLSQLPLSFSESVLDTNGALYCSVLRWDAERGDSVAEVSKISADGTIAWSKPFASPTRVGKLPFVVLGDQEGNTYTSGYVDAASSNWVTTSFAPSGEKRWSFQSDLADDLKEFMVDGVARSNGAVFLLAKQTRPTLHGPGKHVLRSLSPSGQLNWDLEVEDELFSDDVLIREPLALAAGLNSKVLLCSRLTNQLGAEWLELQTFDENGGRLALRGIELGSANRLAAIAVSGDEAGWIVSYGTTGISGMTNQSAVPSAIQARVFRLSSDLSTIWTTSLPNAQPQSCVTASSEALGQSYVSLSDWDGLGAPRVNAITVKLDFQGRSISTNRFDELESTVLSAKPPMELLQDHRGQLFVIPDFNESLAMRANGGLIGFDLRRKRSLGLIAGSRSIWYHTLGDLSLAQLTPRDSASSGVDTYEDWTVRRIHDAVKVLRLNNAKTRVEVLLEFPGEYRIEKAGSLLGPWENLGRISTDHLGDMFFEMDPSTSGTAFYRFIR